MTDIEYRGFHYIDVTKAAATRFKSIVPVPPNTGDRVSLNIVLGGLGIVRMVGCDAILPAVTVISDENPTQVTFTTAHGLATGDTIRFRGTDSTPALDASGNLVATVVDATNITVPVNVTVAGTVGESVENPEELSGSVLLGAGFQQNFNPPTRVASPDKLIALEGIDTNAAVEGAATYSYMGPSKGA